MWFLLHELSTSEFAAEEHAPTIDAHNCVPRLLGHFVYHTMVFGASNSSIVDHSETNQSLKSFDHL